MQCPVCDERLRAIERQGVEIDICPGCKGVWLDRGELEKIITLEAVGSPPAPAREARPEERPRARQFDDDDNDDDDDDRRLARGNGDRRPDADRREEARHPGQPQPRKRESFLGQIFDMFGGD
jgi:Zn-finger nucleic acid-binding protein